MSNSATPANPQPTPANQEKIHRITSLYKQLNKELDEMNLELKIMEKDLRQKIDEVEIKNTLEDILAIKEN